MTMAESRPESRPSLDFVRAIVERDIARGKNGGKVVTRFPPEPNGYLHIGHAKSICLNFGIAQQYGGQCHLRFDDTNPTREEQEYVDSIMADVRWLGWDWGEHLYFASDYFQQLFDWAVMLIRAGKAFVCDLSADEVREHRGTLTQPGRESPYRNRSVEENLSLFERMKRGEFPSGSRTLRARIDMASPNVNLRDPVMYRILHAAHHRTGEKWCIYPMYDWAHGESDWIEGITHSICTLEFEDHRPLYEWYISAIESCGGKPRTVDHRPQQIEFARLNLNYTVMSKRRLLELVEEGHVSGWDDPRMPTIAAMRRRGYTPASIRSFCELVGVARRGNVIDVALLEHAVRDDLNAVAPRAMAVLRPLRVVIENFPDGRSEAFQLANHPDDASLGSRTVTFSRELFIERDDFMEEPPKGFFRLAPGREVRLRGAYLVTCTAVEKDPASGNVLALRCRYDPASRGGNAPDGRKVKSTLHWVSAAHAVDAEVRLYDRLFTVEAPGEGGIDFRSQINPKSLQVLGACKLERALADAAPGSRWQFERQGYFCVDAVDSRPGRLVFNRTVTLRDSWARQTPGAAPPA
jgi:glutaminyl-tRNA synthetase